MMTSLQDRYPFIQDLQHVTRHADETKDVHIENCIGFVPVPVGIAGPLQVEGPNTPSDRFYAPLATTEAALVASCSRGCKAFTQCGGIQFEFLGQSMSRAPAFLFPSPKQAVAFARLIPSLHAQFDECARAGSKHVQLQQLTPHIVGSAVHVRFDFDCADAGGQNMVSAATQRCCDSFMLSDSARELDLQKVLIEGQMTSDKKGSWGNVFQTRGVRTVCWGSITDEVCRTVLKCSTADLYQTLAVAKEGEIRNGQFGSTIDSANVVAAIFIACGQDAASVAEGSWCQLTPEYNHETGELKLSMFYPSLPVGVIGGGTSYPAQKECLGLLKCDGPGFKGRLAGLVAAFALALDVSTGAAVTNSSFTDAHARLRKRVTG